MNSSANNDASDNNLLPYIEFSVFSLTILALDILAKYLMLPSLQEINTDLSRDWFVSVIYQLFGLTLLFFILAILIKIKASHFKMPLLFLSIIIFTSIFVGRFQDFSPDGQWYHLQRVALFPVNWGIENLAFAAQEGPHISFPLLPDNLRGLQLITIPGQGAFSGVAINISVICCAIYFWIKYCSFLPFKLKILSAVSPIATSQMFTYYIDGFIATYGGMLLLISLLPWVKTLPLETELGCNIKAEKYSFKYIGLLLYSMTIAFLVIAQCKYSFPYIFITFSFPIIVLAFVSIYFKSQNHTAPFPFKKFIFLVFALSSVTIFVLANPYFLILKSLFREVDYNYFSIAALSDINDSLKHQMPAVLSETPKYLRFLSTNILSFWPGGPNIIDEDVRQSTLSLIKRLIARLGNEDARYSGFGAMSTFILTFAFFSSIRNIKSIKSISHFSVFSPGTRCEIENTKAIKLALSITFIAQLALSVIFPLGWWARMNPAIYFTATIIFLFSLHALNQKNIGEVSENISLHTLITKIAFVLGITILITALLMPPIIQVLRSTHKMQLFKKNIPSTIQYNSKDVENSTLIFPTNSDSDFAKQLSSATKLIQVNPDLQLKVKLDQSNLCGENIIESESQPKFWFCFVESTPIK